MSDIDESSLDPEYVLCALFDGDRSLRFSFLYRFIAEKKLGPEFISFCKRQTLKHPDAGIEEWNRVVTEAQRALNETKAFIESRKRK